MLKFTQLEASAIIYTGSLVPVVDSGQFCKFTPKIYRRQLKLCLQITSGLDELKPLVEKEYSKVVDLAFCFPCQTPKVLSMSSFSRL